MDDQPGRHVVAARGEALMKSLGNWSDISFLLYPEYPPKVVWCFWGRNLVSVQQHHICFVIGLVRIPYV
jgi:hypothetical protein